MKDQRRLRPGVKLGNYPQRPPSSDNRFERALKGWLRGIRPPPAARRGSWRRFLRQVNSHSETLADAGKNRLTDSIENARRHLNNDGLTQAAIAHAFAVVREVAGRELGMRHFDVQLVGGWILMEGMLAEMRTGEGKTLTATLAACTAAMNGIPVHVVSVNDYLVTRDAEEMMPIYNALGLTVGIITEDLDPDARRKAYACDITYCSNKQLVFDYLKDKLALGSGDPGLKLALESLHNEQPRLDRLLLRGLYFAIVDEADSVLIDEARTPLILSAQGQGEEQIKVCRQALFLAGTPLSAPRAGIFAQRAAAAGQASSSRSVLRHRRRSRQCAHRRSAHAPHPVRPGPGRRADKGVPTSVVSGRSTALRDRLSAASP